MPTGSDNDRVLDQAGANARRLRTMRKLHIAAGLVTVLNWIAALALIFRHPPSLDGLYEWLSFPLFMTVLWFVWNFSMDQLRGRKWSMPVLASMVVGGLFYAVGVAISVIRW